MGGHGSGRYYHSSNTTIEEVKRIDIRFLRRRGMLRPGNVGTINWTLNDGSPAGDIRYTCYAERVVFHYRFRSSGDDWESVDPVVYFDRTPCNMGGERLWFNCPHCRRRCEVLCLNGKWPACRKCYRLPYRSQCEDLMGRLQSRQNKLEAMLWGDNKRKWWRKAKRERLEAEWQRVAIAADEAFVLAAANLLGDDDLRRLLG